jgi:superfamily II DNA or RNA helicase
LNKQSDTRLPYRATEDHYRSGHQSLGSDFFAPCLGSCTSYRRAVGYFSSSALVTWASSIPHIIESNSLKVRVIVSHQLQKNDKEILKSLTDPSERNKYRAMLTDKILEDVISFIETPNQLDKRSKIFAWLISSDRLEIKIAFPTHVEGPGIYHEKIGVFEFPNDDKIAFTGSANETSGGHLNNYESIDVYRSWVDGDYNRIQTKIEQFEEAWSDDAQGLSVKSPSQAVLKRVKSIAPKFLTKADDRPDTPSAGQPDIGKWRHQEEAVERFLKSKSGVLEMATGTGKTRTALKVLTRLFADEIVSSAVVCVEGTDLLDQWTDELRNWSNAENFKLRIYQHYDKHKQNTDFRLQPKGAILVLSRFQLAKFLGTFTKEQREKSIIVHDEVHGLGADGFVQGLSGEHCSFSYRLGLSATPERAYDESGNAFVESEIGKTIYSFPLEVAISRGVLCEFDYTPLPYHLTPGDRERLQKVFHQEAARKRSGTPMKKEEVWMAISKVYKTAEAKPQVFKDYLQQNPDVIKNSIIFVETKEYGSRLLEILHDVTNTYRTYYDDDAQQHLLDFSSGEFDVLVTCHKLSQGIDIQSLQSVILFASARSKLETIQRIGRCLRVDPDNPEKKSHVLDFVREQDDGDDSRNADIDRSEWLSKLSKVRRGDEIAT